MSHKREDETKTTTGGVGTAQSIISICHYDARRREESFYIIVYRKRQMSPRAVICMYCVHLDYKWW